MNMNFCGVTEGAETPVGSKPLPMSSQTRPPPSPLLLSITPTTEFQTPRSTKGDTLGVTASPSPALLNPLTHEFWNESSSERRAPIYCPQLMDNSQSNEPLVQRLQSGFRVKIHDGSGPKGRVVELRLSEDRSTVYVIDDTMTEEAEEDQEEKSPKNKLWDSQLLYTILIEAIARVDDSGEFALSRSFTDVDPRKCFSIVSKTSYDGCFQFDFECISIKQREAVVSALRAVCSKGEKSLHMRRRSLPSFRGDSSAQGHPVRLRLSVTPDTVLSPMHRTCIYPGSGSMEEGTELALSRVEGREPLDDEVNFPRRHSVPADPFSFSEVNSQQSLDEQQYGLEASSSMLAASFQDALDEWCSEDACMDFAEMSESLQGIFFLLETQKQHDEPRGKHARTDSSDGMHVANLCVTDFLATPASIWADLPSPIAGDEVQDSSTRRIKVLRNRAGVAHAQALRWKQLQADMAFESVDRSDRRMVRTIAITKSLDDLDGTEAQVASSERIAKGNFTDTSGYGLFELFPSGLWGYDTADLIEQEDCSFYDSEPECSRVLTRRKGLRRIEAERLNNVAAVEKKSSKRLDFSLPRYAGCRFDDEYASAIIDIMKSEQLSLLWHPTPTESHPNRAPICVTAWIERGTYLMTQAFVQPKFMWRPAQEMNLESRRLNVASESPERVDLLEIARVHGSPNIDRRQFPFARRSRSFVIETQTAVYLFEAQSVHDIKRIVFGLKLTISRLASLIMVRDTRAVEEFFEPVEGVPGEAPSFLGPNRT